MDKPIRVLHILRKLDVGGVQMVIMNNYRCIDKEKVQFDFLVQGEDIGQLENEVLSLGGRIFRVCSIDNKYKYFRDIIKFLRSTNYEVVHVHHNYANLYALLAAKICNVKVRIAHSHNKYDETNYIKKGIKIIVRKWINELATHKLACSETAFKWLFGIAAIDEDNSTIMKNAIDVDKFLFNPTFRTKIRKNYGLESKIVIGHVGHFNEQKNHTFLLDVFQYIRQLREDVHLLLVGSGHLKEEMEKKVLDLNLIDDVTFVEPQLRIEEFFSAFDYFVLPSLHEGLGIVAIEAQVSGVKTFISDDVPKDVMITDYVYELSIHDGAHKWSERMLLHFDNDYKRVNCKDLILKAGYSIEEESKKLEKLYCDSVGVEKC